MTTDDLVESSDFHCFLHLNKLLSGQRQRFWTGRETEMSHSGSNPRLQKSTTQGYKSWSHGTTNVSIPEVNMLKNSSTLAVSITINISTKLGFVFVNCLRETYFVDALRSF